MCFKLVADPQNMKMKGFYLKICHTTLYKAMGSLVSNLKSHKNNLSDDELPYQHQQPLPTNSSSSAWFHSCGSSISV